MVPVARKWLIRGSRRSSSMNAGSLCSTTHVAIPVSPGSHGGEVVLGVDAAGGQRAAGGRSACSTTSMAMLSQRTSDPSRSVICSSTARWSRVVRIDSVDLEELALRPRSWRSRASRLLAEARGRVRVGHRLGRERRVDHQEAQVVLGELAQAALHQDDDAQARALVHHRREDHRLVQVVLGARDRDGARVVRGVVHELRRPGTGPPSP